VLPPCTCPPGFTFATQALGRGVAFPLASLKKAARNR
jgi:hypothetical protein